jgi:hypothetical protein
MAVRVDEAGNDDAVRRFDHRDGIARDGNVRPDLADFPVLYQHIRPREIADLPVERQHHASFEQDAALCLQTGQLGIVAGLGPDRRRQHRRHCAASGQRSASRKEAAA